jgi:hypothetical protein
MQALCRTHILLSTGLGALLEILVFFSLVPKDSTQPPTRFQEFLGYTQAPGGSAFFSCSVLVSAICSINCLNRWE